MENSNDDLRTHSFKNLLIIVSAFSSTGNLSLKSGGTKEKPAEVTDPRKILGPPPEKLVVEILSSLPPPPPPPKNSKINVTTNTKNKKLFPVLIFWTLKFFPDFS